MTTKTSPTPRSWRWRERLLLMLIGGGLGLLSGEIALRLIGFADPILYTYDALVGVRLLPGLRAHYDREGDAAIQINRAGFRDRDREIRKPAHTYRIAVLGDSFTEALQVPLEQTFTYLLEQKLNAAHCMAKPQVEVLNFGVSGYGTTQAWLLLQQEVVRYAPDLVVLAMCTGNDLRNNSKALEPRKLRPFFVWAGDTLTLETAFNRDRLWYVKTHWLWPLQRRSRVLQLLQRTQASLQARFTPPTFLTGEPGLDAMVYHAPPPPAWEDAWRITEAALLQIQAEVARARARLLVVTLSNGIQVHPDAAQRQAFMAANQLADLFYPDTRIKAFGARHGFAVLNLAPRFATYALTHQVFLHGFANTALGVGHWNQRGHALAADVIAATICAAQRGSDEILPNAVARQFARRVVNDMK